MVDERKLSKYANMIFINFKNLLPIFWIKKMVFTVLNDIYLITSKTTSYLFSNITSL